MKAIKVSLPTGQSLTFRKGEGGVRDIHEHADDYTVHEVDNVIVTFDSENDGDEEWGEPRMLVSKRLVTVID